MVPLGSWVSLFSPLAELHIREWKDPRVLITLSISVFCTEKLFAGLKQSAILQAVTVRATGRGCRWKGCTEMQHPQSLETDIETRVEPVRKHRGLRWMALPKTCL